MPIVGQSEPPALVIKAESSDTIKQLASQIGLNWTQARLLSDRADAHGLEIGRLICERAQHPEILAKLTALNRGKNGSPKLPHCFVAELVAAEFANGVLQMPTERHMQRCARAFLKAVKKGLPLNTPIRIAEATQTIGKVADHPAYDVQPSPERLFNPDESDDDRESHFDPEHGARIFARKVRTFFYDPHGHPRLRTPKQKIAFARTLNMAFEELNIDWEMTPKGAQ